MLLELKVSHFAIIDSLEVRFLRPGLNVLTGETGAGKSILLRSLALLLGGKASPDMIRSGCEQAVIEGAFDLSLRPDLKNELKEQALESGDDSLVIRRIISQSGKHRLYINGNLSTLNVLERVVQRLVEITGQNEHHSLTKPSSQLKLLDLFAQLDTLKTSYSEAYFQAKKLVEEIENLKMASREREQRLDFLNFQIQEIEAFDPKSGEDDELLQKFQKVRSSSKLQGFAQKAESTLYSDDGAIHSLLTELAQEGQNLLQIDPSLGDGVKSLKEASMLLEEAAYVFRKYVKEEGLDPQEMDRVEERLSDLKKLQKKYGNTADEILTFKEKAISERDTLEKNDDILKELVTKLEKCQKEVAKLGEELHKKRSKASSRLSEGINKEIKDLNMTGTVFSVQITKKEEAGPEGFDEIAFMIQASSKEVPRSMGKIASGGELSRLMLAIKQVVAGQDQPMTYLFDEVDAGVSGPTAEKVGRKLKSIGRNHQVICITHLPQVAAFADAHFLITKETSKGLVKSQVTELSTSDRVQELGRLISGEKVTKAGLVHARQMIENVRSF